MFKKVLKPQFLKITSKICVKCQEKVAVKAEIPKKPR